MSKLTTQEIIAIAQDAKRDRKTVKLDFKASPEEKARYQALAEHLGLNLSAIIRTILNQACEDVGLSRDDITHTTAIR